MRLLAFLIMSAACACQREPLKVSRDPVERPRLIADILLPALPRPTTGQEAIKLLRTRGSEEVLFEGVYEVDATNANGSRFGWVRIEDGTRVLVTENVGAPELALVGSTLYVSGTLRTVGITRDGELKSCNWQVVRRELSLYAPRLTPR